jgi:hypothetical protein
MLQTDQDMTCRVCVRDSCNWIAAFNSVIKVRNRQTGPIWSGLVLLQLTPQAHGSG